MNKNHFIIIISLLVVILINYLGLFEAVNEHIYDNYFLLNRDKNVSSNIVIVAIDDRSLKELGPWPWKRSIHSQLIKKILGFSPAVTGINIEYLENKNPDEDKELYDILKSSNNIVISSVNETENSLGEDYVTVSKSIFSDINHGHTYIKLSEKSVIRSFSSYKSFPAFALEIVKSYFKNKTFNHPKMNEKFKKLLYIFDSPAMLEGKSNLLIDYKRTSDKYKKYSAVDILNNNVNSQDFKNKIVLIGVTGRTVTNSFATPFTANVSATSTSTELQAQIIDSFLDYRGLTQVNDIVILLLSVLIGLGFFYLVQNIRIMIQGILFIGVFLTVIILDFILFKFMALWYPPTLTLALLTVSFALSVYLTTTRVDNQLIKAMNKFSTDKKLPIIDMPTELNSKVDALTNLLEIINDDRQTIKAIINGINNGILVMDQTGKVIWANENVMNIFKNSMVMGQNIEELSGEIVFKDIKDTMDQSQLFKKEIITNFRDYLVVVNPIQGELKRYVVIFNDISDLKQIDRMKSQMFRIASHELKSPLMTIQVSSENISFFRELEQIDENNKSIFEASEFMLSIIDNFLNLNKLESAQMPAMLSMTSICQLINNSIKLSAPSAEKKQIEIITNLPDLPETLVDPNQILIVLNNLISNAIKYSPENSKIEITGENLRDKIKVSVKDSGIGIKEEELDKIFDRFYRSDDNIKHNIRGTGLGLSIVKRIVENHGGQVSITSEYGRGTCMSFTLPVKDL